jgi:hypothetical protein
VSSPLPLHNYDSILIHLLEPSSSKSGETWVRNMKAEFCLQDISFHVCDVLLHAVNRRHRTDSFTSLLKEVMLWIFITLKNPSSSARFEPVNNGPSGKHATTRPQLVTLLVKLLIQNFFHVFLINYLTMFQMEHNFVVNYLYYIRYIIFKPILND